MFITYQPEDGDKQTWDFDPDRVRQGAAELIEKRFGTGFEEWKQGVLVGNSKARRVLLWHLIRQTHHTLRYEDTPDFMMRELLVEQSVAEVAEMRDRVLKAKMSDELREQVLTGLDLQLADALAREGVEEAEVPKAG